VTGAQVDIAIVALHIVDAVGNDDAICLAAEIMVIDL
jgi:hypothetical protein